MTASPSLPEIQFTLSDGSVQSPVVRQASVTLGRSVDNDLVLDEVSISRHHARLTFEDGHTLIEDLGSSNGTFIDSMRLEPHQAYRMETGQSLQFGSVNAALRQPETQPAAPVPASQLAASPGSLGDFLKKNRLPLAVTGAVGGLAALVCLVAAFCLLFQNFGFFGKRIKAQAGFCNQPAMQVIQQGGQIYQLTAAQTAVPGFTPAPGPQSTQDLSSPAPTFPPGTPGAAPTYPSLSTVQSGGPSGPTGSSGPAQPLLTTAFLEVPFPFDGGNINFGGSDAQFKTASQRNLGGNHGRINSFFDHLSPLYPAPKDPGSPGGLESPDEPAAKHIMVYWGVNDKNLNYSGHPAIDFSTFEYMQPTTPVFAAADGVVTYVGIHKASGALYITIKHTVANVGDFETIYWHLNPDDFFEAMKDQVGRSIIAGTRIGTMGNTGWSTGHHLHFEVRFDRNHDGQFPQTETVDPYGWLGSADIANDPWTAQSGMVSNYLWKHPLGSSAVVPANGGGSLDQPGGTGGAVPSQQLCVQPGTFPPGGTVNYSWAPDPDTQSGSVGLSGGCALNVKDAQGKPVTQFPSPVQVTIPFTDQDLQNIDPNSLTIYWQKPGSPDWMPLPTTLDLANKIASAVTSYSGLCSLMGKPTKDVLPPTTNIQVNADHAPDGSMYDAATVVLDAADPSGVKTTFYSLDGGSSWKVYNGPFQLQPSGIPQPAEMDSESFGGGPGSFLVLAYSVDRAGNVQNPPSYAYFSIDPSKDPRIVAPNPDKAGIPSPTLTPSPAATPTPTPSSTPTPTPSFTPTVTPTVCAPKLVLVQNANCRNGPSTRYSTYTSFFSGTILDVSGWNDSFGSPWVLVQVPNDKASCWVSVSSGTLEGGDLSCRPFIDAPPTYTPTPTVTRTPTPTPTPTPTFTEVPGFLK